MYLRTVRGEIRMPSFNSSSFDRIDSTWLHTPCDIQTQLLSEEEILSFDRFRRSHAEPQPRKYVTDQGEYDGNSRAHERIMPHGQPPVAMIDESRTAPNNCGRQGVHPHSEAPYPSGAWE